jgi:hypothetical protein
MSIEQPEPAKHEEPEKPEPRDDRWDEVGAAVKAAYKMGFTDVSELTEIINATRNEDLRAAVNNILEKLSESRVKWRALVERFGELIKARELIAEKQALTEGALLDRIGELAKNTDDAEDLLALATAYAPS